MFKEVVIKNFALIDDLHLKLYDGLNIIMGETGSGKSNLIDSISVLMGNRVQKDKIRIGKESAYISGVFDIENNNLLIQYLKDNNYYDEDGGLVLSREIFIKSSTISRVNNIPVPSSVIKEISKYLIDIYGQFENITILSKQEQRNFIDSLGPEEHKKTLSNYENLYNEYSKKNSALIKYKKTPEEVSKSLDFLLYQIEDIETSKVLEINEEELDKRLEIIENYQYLRDSVIKILSILTEDGSDIMSGLGRINKYTEDICRLDSTFIDVSNRMEQIYIETEDVKREIEYYFESLNFDEEEYNLLDSKRSILFEAKRKYGNSLKDINEFYKNAVKQVDEINNYELNLKNKEDEIKNLKLELIHISELVTNSRKKITSDFISTLKKQLKELDMEDTNFKVDFKEIDLNLKGKDEITFMISFNKNEPLREFSSVASGGEISRFMLAIKSIEAEVERTPTIIFDEIDSGISGNAGSVVGNKLKSLSINHQLICISHLPQIIAKGDKQFLVYKENLQGKIYSNVKELLYDDRIEELARIIEGDKYSTHTYKTAKQMIDDNLRGEK